MGKSIDRTRDERAGPSDGELMARVRAANGDALDALFRRYRRMVYGVALDILRDAGEAEDVTQEVFLEVYRKSYLYDPARGSVRVWFLQYAYHRTLRRKAALRRRAAYRGEPLERAEGSLAKPPRQLTPEECRWVIRAGLAQLPPRQRATLEMACFEELTLRDVAARLGVSLGCARHYYYRGLERLRTWARRLLPSTSAARDAVPLDEPVELVPGEAERGRRPAAVRAAAFQGGEYIGGRRQGARRARDAATHPRTDKFYRARGGEPPEAVGQVRRRQR